MLYLMRKIGESIIINDTIEVKVVEVRGKSVKLGFEFPPTYSVLRKEVHDRIVQENLAASSGAMGGFSASDFAGAISNLSSGTILKAEPEAEEHHDPEPPKPAAPSANGGNGKDKLTLRKKD